MNKLCVRCGKLLSTENFTNDITRIDKKYPYCKSCVHELRNTDKERERAKNYVKKVRYANPELRRQRVNTERERRYKRLYGITVEEYDEMVEFQEGKCAICGRPPKNRRLCVDHNHKTGEVRGLLCFMCNRTLHGRITIDWLFNAYEYLDVPPVHDALGRTPVGIMGSIKKRKRKLLSK